MAKTRKASADDRDRPASATGEPPIWPMDETDATLISMLERDGRVSYADLAAAVGLTPGGARARVKRLQENRVLKVVGVTNPYAVGLQSVATLHIEVSGNIDAVAAQLSEYDAVRYIVLGSGSYSILVEAYAETPQALFTLINREIREVPGVSRIATFVHESVHTHHPIFPLTAGADPR